ncbi:MAG: restriction endonuclease subunit S [Verrucomicrobiota bacterium]
MKSNWRTVTLRDVVQINPSRPMTKGATVPFLAMDAIEPWRRQVAAWQERPFTGSGPRFKNGDTLVARITPCLENGKTVYANFLPDGAVGNGSTELIVLSGIEGTTDNLFIYYLARSEDFREFAIQRMEGTSGRQRVPAPVLRSYAFDLPPLPEQEAISAILGALDDKIETSHRMNRTLEGLAQSLFTHTFPFTPEDELPEG